MEETLRAGLVAFLVKLYDKATETLVNGMSQQDRMTYVSADGSFALKLNGEDNVIVDLAGVGSRQVESHALALPGKINNPDSSFDHCLVFGHQ